jgi:signal transduction histidine kinase
MSDAPTGALCYLNRAADATVPVALTSAERAVLEAVNDRVAAAPSLPRLIDFVFEQCKSILPTNRISVAFLEDDGRRLVSNYTRTDYEEIHLRPGYTEPLSGTSLEHVIAAGEPRIIGDLEQHLEYRPKSRSTRLILRENLRSSMTCPLRVDDRIVGVLFHSSQQPHAFTPRHLVMHQAIVSRLSQAIEKAYRIEQLTEANRAYTKMLGFVSHELKNPIASIVMHGKLLTEGYLGPLSEQQQDAIRRMIDKGEYLLSLIREYLDLARIESGELELNAQRGVAFIAEVVEPAIEILEPQRDEKRMSIVRDWPDRPVAVECDPTLMRIVMVNLLGNAVKYGNEGGQIRITVLPEDARTRVTVWNEGPGFPQQERYKLFRRFSRLHNDNLHKRQGTGVGLYSSWRIIELHGGKIRADSKHGKWAEFSFHFPQPLPQGRVPEAADESEEDADG